MARGRPTKSMIRQNIVEILHFLGDGYAYDIFRIYREIFPKVAMRSIYYHLKKGVETDEFKVKDIRSEKGDYSWGSDAEKIYYVLGPSASPLINQDVKDFFDKR